MVLQDVAICRGGPLFFPSFAPAFFFGGGASGHGVAEVAARVLERAGLERVATLVKCEAAVAVCVDGREDARGPSLAGQANLAAASVPGHAPLAPSVREGTIGMLHKVNHLV